jgi:hypothetical protein
VSDVFFTDSSEAPVPPEEVRLRTLDASLRPDGVRVDVHLELTPFQERPNLELSLANAEGRDLASLSVVEAIDPKMDFTMHLRQPDTEGTYNLKVQVFYSDVEANAPSNGSQSSAGEILKKSKTIVDQRQVQVEVTKK